VGPEPFSTFVNTFQSSISVNIRGTFITLSTSELTPGFLAAVQNETDVSWA
jgi:hypothetical protein